MSNPRFVGSQIHLAFQPKFPTFTPDTFKRVLDKKGFTSVQTQAISPQGQTFQVQSFSKGDLIIFLVPNPVSQTPPQIAFQILNTVNLVAISEGTSFIDTIKDILAQLNIGIGSVASMAFNCTTAVATEIEPVKVLTSGMKTDLLSGISKALGKDSLSVVSIALGTSFPLPRKGLQLRLEPLASNPQKQYYMNIVFQTDDENEFDEFIRGFGENIVEEIIRLVGKNV